MSLRASPIERKATLPDGRVVTVRVSVPDDSYVPKRLLDTVVLELISNGMHLAGVTTLLDADQDSAARELVHEVVVGLEDGTLKPTAGALEPLADRLWPE